MNLPHPDRAVVDPAKVRDYLLSPVHPIGRFKARFFGALGFSASDWIELRHAILQLAMSVPAELGPATPFGQKYHTHGIIQGRLDSAAVVAVWIVLAHEDFPRFITAFPDEPRHERSL